ncbi:MAG: ABC transporter ATP-binding protein [Nitrososphaeria archaeon]
MTQIELRNISKQFAGKKVLDNVSLIIESQTFTSILGPTNSGKTTLLKIISGVIKPDSGKVFFDGNDVTNVPPQKRNIGVIFQSFALYPNLTVYENIAAPLRVKKLSEKEIDKRVREQAEILKIDKILNKKPTEISGGEAQRTALARALVKDASVYLLDEPLTNLDYKLREDMKILLKRILEAKKSTIIYATPSPDEALAFSTKVAFLMNGRLLHFGVTQECFNFPPSVEVGKLCSVPPMNIINSNIAKKDGKNILTVANKFEVNISHLDIKEEGQCFVGIYPYNIYLTPQSNDAIEVISNLELQEIAGSEMTLTLKWNSDLIFVYVPYIKPLEKIVKVYINPTDMYIYNKEGKLVTKIVGRG